MSHAINLALIYGSTREGRFCDTVASWAGEQVWRRGYFHLDMIDPAVLEMPIRHLREDNAELRSVRRRLDRADAFLIVTPEYNHGYPAPLKFLIDSADGEWRAKPVAFVSYGGVSGGLRAVEQLRQVFAELHAVTIRNGVSFARARSQFDSSGLLQSPDEAEESMAALLSNLRWWATALRKARKATAYDRQAA